MTKHQITDETESDSAGLRGNGESVTKAIVLLTRKKSMSQKEFSTYWKSVHGPLAAKELPGVIRYVQNHITDTFARGGFPSKDYDVDGVVELWFESEEAMLEAFASEGSQNVLQDAANFIERMTVVVVEENEVLNIASEGG